MMPDAARNVAAQLRDQAADAEKNAAFLRENARMLSDWADIMDAAVAQNFRDIMPADLIAYLDTPPVVPKAPAIPDVLVAPTTPAPVPPPPNEPAP